MATQPNDNESRLRDAEVVIAGELPREYQAVARGLTPDELDVIVAVKKRLDEAERVSGSPIGENWIAP
jgi:hypothetical protein